MVRTLISETPKRIGEQVTLKGWVNARRDHGKIIFIDLRDSSGVAQLVCNQKASGLRNEDVIEIKGIVQKRPDSMVNPNLPTGTVEVAVSDITVLEKSATLPFDMGAESLNVELPTLLDYRPLTLRHPKVKAIFRIQETIINAFREGLRKDGFTEFQAPAIVPVSTEGGAEIFPVQYYNYQAFLGQSPQLYKQMMVGVFEKVFTVGKAYRAEPSVTTRHLSEYITLDAEFGFIDSWLDLMNMAEKVLLNIFSAVEKENAPELKLFGATIPKVTNPLPKMKMREAQQIIFERTGRDNRKEPDLEPEDEKEICRYSKELFGSELIFITHYPTKKRPFYTYPDPKDPEYTLSFDLLGRGLEWITGGQRINNYEKLLENVKKWGNKPEDFKLYLQAFEYGMPPEGGFALGAERITMQILGLSNIREASLFPRDMERVDIRLSNLKNNTKGNSSEKVYTAIKQLFEKNEIAFKEFEHEAVRTSKDAARVRGTDPKMGAKAILFNADKKPILIVLPGSKKIDTKKFKEQLKINNLEMLTAEEVKELTGLEIGSIPPLGNVLNLPTYFDKSLSENEIVAFNAGFLTKSMEVKYQDLEKIVQPTISEFAIFKD